MAGLMIVNLEFDNENCSVSLNYHCKECRAKSKENPIQRFPNHMPGGPLRENPSLCPLEPYQKRAGNKVLHYYYKGALQNLKGGPVKKFELPLSNV